jgi:hypothetical protein
MLNSFFDLYANMFFPFNSSKKVEKEEEKQSKEDSQV